MSQDDKQEESPTQQATRLLNSSPTLEAMGRAPLAMVARLLADHPGIEAAVREVCTGVSGALDTEAGDSDHTLVSNSYSDADAMRAWALSAAVVHEAVVDVPQAADRMHEDLAEYLTSRSDTSHI